MPMISRRRFTCDCETDLAAGIGGRLQQRHPMAALAGDARRFEPRRPGANHHDLPRRSLGALDIVGQGGLAAGGGIVDAEGAKAVIDAVDAIGGADAGTDILFAPGGDLVDDMGIGDVGAGHAHHVQLAAGHRMARRSDVADARGMEDREFRRLLHLADEIQMGRRGHAGDGNDLGQRRVMIDMAADDVEEIHLAGGDDAAADLQPFVLADALVPILVRHQAGADDEVRPHGLAHGVDHAEGEAQAVIEGAAILVRALVGGRRPELVHQVAVAFEFDAIEAGGLHALRGRGILPDDPLDVPILDLLGNGAVGGLADGRGREDRQPVRLVPDGAAAEMGNLDHDRAAMFVAFVGQALHRRHDLVLVDMEVTEDCRRVRRHHGRTGGHGHGDAALGLLHMVEPVLLSGHAVVVIVRLMGRGHDPVLEREVLEPEGLQQGIVGAGGAGHRRGFHSQWVTLFGRFGPALAGTIATASPRAKAAARRCKS